MAKPLIWMRAVRDAVPRFTRTRREVLLMLGLRMNADGSGFASHRQLANDADAGKRTAERATSDARRRGYLVQTRRGHRIDAETVVASEWELTVPVDNSTQPVTMLTGWVEANPPERQTQPVRDTHPTRHNAGGPRGLPPEVPPPEPRRVTHITQLLLGNGARTQEEATAILDKIQSANPGIRNLHAYLSGMAERGTLAAAIAKAQADSAAAAQADRGRRGERCHRCAVRYTGSVCPQCGAPREDNGT